MRLAWVAFVACGAAMGLARCSDDTTCSGDAADACSEIVPTPLTVAVTPDEIWVQPNAAPNIAVALGRGPGGDGDVIVTIATDAGVIADSLTIPAASSQGTLVLHIEPSFIQGDGTLVIDAATTSVLAQASVVVHVAGASGALDTSFGSGGLLDLTPATGSDVGHAMISLQSGLIVGGTHIEQSDASSVSSMKVLRVTSAGVVDGTFATTFAPGELASLAMLPDGRIFAVGDVRTPKADFAAVRILASGGLDPLYTATTSLTSLDDVGLAAAIQPSGALVAAGSAGAEAAFALVRYTQAAPLSDAGSDAADASDAVVPTSVPDPTFGDAGVTLTSFAQPNAGASSLLVAGDGTLFALGFARDTQTDIVAVRYTPNGAVDTTYGEAGVSMVPLATGTFGAAAALLDPNGNVVACSDDSGQGLVLRLLANGALDPAFGNGGLAALSIGSSSTARALALDRGTGKILVGGGAGSPSQCFVARLSAMGALDTTFASAGSLVTSGSTCDVAAVAVENDGRILVLETITQGSATHMVVQRYWP